MRSPGSAGGEAGEARGGLSGTVLRAIGVSGLGYLATQGLTLGFYLVLARLATPEDFGELAAGAIVVNLGVLVFGLESGLMTAIVQRRDRVEEAAATATVATVLAGLLFSGLALAVSPLVGAFFDSDVIGEVAAATSAMILLRTVTVVPLALLQRRFAYVRRLAIEPIGVVVFGVTAVIATSKGMGVWGLVLGNYAQAVADVILSWALVRWRPNLGLVSFGMWRELAGYARHVLAATVVLRINNQVPSALIGRFVGAGALGQFRYGIRIAGLPFAFTLAAGSYVLLPAFSRIAAELPRLRSAFLRALHWMTSAGLLGALLLLGLGKPAAELVFGRVWTDAGYAAMVLCLYPAAGAVISVVSEAVAAYGRPSLQVRVHGAELVVGVAAMLAMLPLGLLGVAGGVSIGTLAGAIYALVLIGRLLEAPLRSLGRELAAPALCAAAIGGGLLALEALVVQAPSHGSAIGLLLLTAEAAVAVAAYALALHLFSRERSDELRSLIRASAGRRVAELPADGGIDAVPAP